MLFSIIKHSDSGPVNIGCGEHVSIKELAKLNAREVGYRGTLDFDTIKPDGTQRK
jgi:GDP-L-fucose synthase